MVELLRAKSPPNLHLLLISHNDKNWQSYTSPKEYLKMYKSGDTPLISFDINIFSQEINIFCYIQKYRQKLHFDTFFIISLTCFLYIAFKFLSHGLSYIVDMIIWSKFSK